MLLKRTANRMKWLGLAALFGCSTTKQESLVSGPFEICWDVTESRSGAWFNNGGDFNAKQYTAFFSVRYQGKRVQVPAFDRYWGSPRAGTGKEKPVAYFWQALFLKDAPRPAVIVGMHSMHLITEENGQPLVTPLHEQDGGFATYQWLDSDNGQPGAVNTVYLGDDSGSSRFLTGGRYLLVNSSVVLDVQTLQVYPCQLNTYDLIKKLDDYNAGQSFVVQLSPHGTQMVLVGSRPDPEDRMLSHQYGLVAMDFKKNTAYVVPFDRTDTQFFSVWDAGRKWIDTYFEWTTDPAGEDRLALRKFKRLPYWQGRWNLVEETGEIASYQLMPVKNNMLPAFLEFIRKAAPVRTEKRVETPYWDVGDSSEGPPTDSLVTVDIHTDHGDLEVFLNPEEQTLTLRSENSSLTKQLGDAFDREMLRGKFQEYFGRFK